MSARAASLGFLVAFEAKLAWRRLAGERRRIAIAALLIFWLGLHAAAFHGLAGLRTEAFSRMPMAAVGLATLFAAFAMLATAFGLAAHGLFERRDLDLVFGAPVPARTVWAARAIAIASTSAAFPAYFGLPFAHAAAWHGEARLLAAYPALAAVAILSSAVALLATLALVRIAGPRRARVLAQVLGALVGAVVFLAFQAHSFLPEAWRAASGTWMDSPSGKAWVGDASPLWSLSRALVGDPLPLAGLVATAAAAFALAVRIAARAHAKGALEAIAMSRSRGAGGAGQPARFGRSLAGTVIAKEWRLIVRDPRAILHTLLPLLYLAPLLIAGVRRGEGASLMAPSVVVLAGFLAGGLAWLAASGEEAPDLLSGSPVRPARLVTLKAASACLPAMAVALPFIALEALREGGAPIVFAACLAGSIGASAYVQIAGAEPGARRDLGRGSQPGRWISLIEHLGAAGWGLACWGAIAPSAWAFAGLGIGLGAPVAAFLARPRAA